MVPLEVNPRYTSSVEVIERTSSMPLIHYHELACQGRLPDNVSDPTGVMGKAVLYAPRDIEFSMDLPGNVNCDGDNGVILADIPARGALIKNGHPVLTILLRGKNCDTCLRSLSVAADKIYKLLLSPHKFNRMTSTL